jgi:hypothetical protein
MDCLLSEVNSYHHNVIEANWKIRGAFAKSV